MSGTAILVVDDEPGYRDLLEAVLKARGHAVDCAASAREALKLFSPQRHHLVLTDLELPGEDGLGLIEALKDASPDTQVLVMTSRRDLSPASSAVRRGAYAFVLKPWEPEEIVLLAEQALTRGRGDAIAAVYEVARAVFASPRLETLLPRIAELAAGLLEAEDVSIMVAHGERLKVVAAYGPGAKDRLGAELALGERVAGQAARNRETLSLTGPLESDPRFAGLQGFRAVRSALVHPLVLDGELLGVINASRLADPRPFGPAERRNVAVFGAHVAQALRNSRTLSELERRNAELEAARSRLETVQARLLAPEKAALAARMAAGLAHELNNPLTGILIHAELLSRDLGLEEGSRQAAEEILEHAERCRRVVASLLHMARREPPRLEPLLLAELVRGALRAASAALGSAEVALAEGADETRLWGDRVQLETLLVNLLTNAAHAMAARPRRRLTLDWERGGGTFRLRVRDTGVGIPAADRERLFEPFFTTKAPGRGTGLGLYLCREIAVAHGGILLCESSDGEGAAFTLSLPDGPPGRARRALVVDDEPCVRRAIARLLDPEGLEVTQAGGAAEARAAWAAAEFDLLITDLNMGGGPDGLTLLAEFRRLRPAAAAILVSGSADPGEVQRGRALGASFLEKPFEADALRAAVRAALARRPAG